MLLSSACDTYHVYLRTNRVRAHREKTRSMSQRYTTIFIDIRAVSSRYEGCESVRGWLPATHTTACAQRSGNPRPFQDLSKLRHKGLYRKLEHIRHFCNDDQNISYMASASGNTAGFFLLSSFQNPPRNASNFARGLFFPFLSSLISFRKAILLSKISDEGTKGRMRKTGRRVLPSLLSGFPFMRKGGGEGGRGAATTTPLSLSPLAAKDAESA